MTKKIIFTLISLLIYLPIFPLDLEKERIAIGEIKDLLEKGTPPAENPRQWAGKHMLVLQKSDTPAVQKLGSIFQHIYTGNVSQIEYKVIGIFTEAIRTHHPNFSLGWIASAKAFAAGAKWWAFSQSSYDNKKEGD